MGKCILVIDDDAAVRQSFVLSLEDTGYKVDVAESGPKGIIMKNNGDYGLIFLDLKMPEMNGIEVLTAIRKTDKVTPVYVVTAFHKEFLEELSVATKLGLEFQLFKKPIGAEEICALTTSIFEGPTPI